MTGILQTTALAALLAASTAIPQAVAAEEPAAGLSACRGIDDDGARLTCYDRLAGRNADDDADYLDRDDPDDRGAAGDPPLPPATPAPAARPAAAPPASETAPRAPAEAPPAAQAASAVARDVAEDEDDDEDYAATVVQVRQKPRGELVITLDNGETWEEIEPSRYFPVEPGDRVEIRTGFFGTYRMVSPAGRDSRVRQVR